VYAVNVKDFLTKHPGAGFNMMTPGGFVRLSPEEAKDLLEGQSTKGHPGDPAMAMEISAEELLTQAVNSSNFKDGAWHILTVYSQQEGPEIKELDRDQILEQLREKLDRNISDYRKAWGRMSSDVLTGYAQEIEATRVAYNELYSGYAYSEEKLEYLLRFENPLEVMRDRWIEEQCRPDVSEEMNHVLWSVMTDPDTEVEYALDGSYTPVLDAESGQGQTEGMKLC
jgi:hypothetical protein